LRQSAIDDGKWDLQLLTGMVEARPDFSLDYKSVMRTIPLQEALCCKTVIYRQVAMSDSDTCKLFVHLMQQFLSGRRQRRNRKKGIAYMI